MTTTTSAMQLTAMPTVQVSTLIRRPPAEVVEAFDPAERLHRHGRRGDCLRR